jgi:uncharacterized protein
MIKKHLVLLMILAATGCRLFRSEAALPVKLAPDAASKIEKEIAKDRADTADWLRTSPTSYLAATDRVEFGEKKTLTVGSAEDNDLRLSPPGIEPHHLWVTVTGDQFRVECVDAKAEFTVKNEAKREATLGPVYIHAGRYSIRLSHQHFPALIVFDPQSPHYKEYKGLAYFPVDFSYRYELPLKRYAKPEKLIIKSTRNNERSAESVGLVEFIAGNQACQLEVVRLIEPGSEDNDLSVYFRDATSGKESYPMGRYVDLKKTAGDNYLLDFNMAYNPACAFSEYYNCPVPPKTNTLAVAIRAGEMNPHYH